MIKAAIELGLTPEIARKLTLKTALGGVKMAINSDDDLETLRQNVTSPGGTTERAIAAFNREDMQGTIVRAISEARERSIELSQEADNDA